MSNYIPLVCADVITNPWLKLDDGLAYPSVYKRPQVFCSVYDWEHIVC